METLLTILEVAARVLGLWLVAAIVVAVLFAVVLTLDRRRNATARHRRPVGVHARGRS